MSELQPEKSRGLASSTLSNLPAQTIETARGFNKTISLFVHPLTRMHKIPVFKRLLFFLFLMAIYDGFVSWLFESGISQQILKESSNAGYISAIFGLLLVFRTNSAYERWWEGRRLWGQLVNDSRNLAIKVQAYVSVPPEEKQKLTEQIVSFAFALKNHLRDSRPTKDLPGIKPISLIPQHYHLPSQVVLSIYETVGTWRQRNMISEYMMQILDPHLKAFMDISGACERIKSSPLPVSYRAFMRQGIALNLVILPWYVGPQLDIWMSLPIVLIGSYFLIGLELIAEAIEDPFGNDGDDLPLDQICAGIQKVVTEINTTECSSANAKVDSLKAMPSTRPLPVDPLKYTSAVKALPVDPLKYTSEIKKLPIDPLKSVHPTEPEPADPSRSGSKLKALMEAQSRSASAAKVEQKPQPQIDPQKYTQSMKAKPVDPLKD